MATSWRTDAATSRRMATCYPTRDTGPEVLLRSALHRRGHRFRKHVKGLPGTPDVVFPTARVAVLVDGCFWHGCRWHFKPPKRNRRLWLEKIERNRARDRRNRRALRRAGWVVVRLWEHQIERALDECVGTVEAALAARRT